MKWILLTLLHYNIIVISSPSITGVTYMDNFDFEQRYKDVNECNPFHWYPLHLPEVCADMFEKLIRSRLQKASPLRLMRERVPDDMYPEKGTKPHHHHHSYIKYDIDTDDNHDDDQSRQFEERRHLTPYGKMLELLKKDIKKAPSIPKITVLPNLGPVALYNQEISKKSEAMIKEIAGVFAKSSKKMYANYFGYNNSPDPQLYIWNGDKNQTEGYNNKKKKSKNKISRTKTKHAGVITIVETKDPSKRRRRSVSYLFDF